MVLGNLQGSFQPKPACGSMKSGLRLTYISEVLYCTSLGGSLSHTEQPGINQYGTSMYWCFRMSSLAVRGSSELMQPSRSKNSVILFFEWVKRSGCSVTAPEADTLHPALLRAAGWELLEQHLWLCGCSSMAMGALRAGQALPCHTLRNIPAATRLSAHPFNLLQQLENLSMSVPY